MNKDNQLISERYKTILLKENTQEFDFTKEDDDKLSELSFNDPKQYEKIKKKLFEKYFESISNKEWIKIKEIIGKNKLICLSDISYMYNIYYKQKINDLRNKIKKAKEEGTIDDTIDDTRGSGSDQFYSIADDIETALDFGVGNADDTYHDDEHPDYYWLAYNSIANTSPFTDNQYVQDWYYANGYAG